MSKAIRFNKNSYLIGCIHNSNESRNFIKKILNSKTFDYYLLELNKDNLNFIMNNNFHFSEFYQIINTIHKAKIKLIDIDYKTELKHYNTDILYQYITHELAKYTFYYMHDMLEEDLMRYHPIYNTHIKLREEYMLSQIRNYKDKDILTVVGLYHFDYIYSNLLI
jgi:pheromone shutdown protein TraB